MTTPATKHGETFSDQLRRVEAMAEDDGETWDLSENDSRALFAVVRAYEAMELERNELMSALRILADESGCADPDCCEASIAQAQARARAVALITRLDGEASGSRVGTE